MNNGKAALIHFEKSSPFKPRHSTNLAQAHLDKKGILRRDMPFSQGK